MEKPIIAESTVDYIRTNKEELALRFPGLFLIFKGSEILGKFKKNWEAKAFIEKRGLEGVIIWSFDPLPTQTGLRLMADKEGMKLTRAKALAAKRQKKFYKKNRARILAERKAKRNENPEKNRKAVKTCYYKNHKRTLAMKKAQSMKAVCTNKICTV